MSISTEYHQVESCNYVTGYHEVLIDGDTVDIQIEVLANGWFVVTGMRTKFDTFEDALVTAEALANICGEEV